MLLRAVIQQDLQTVMDLCVDHDMIVDASIPIAVGMVLEKSALPDQGTAPEAHAKAARPLQVLRNYWKLRQPSGIPGGSAKDLAQQLPRRRRDDNVTRTEFLCLKKRYSLPPRPDLETVDQ
jgi:hypothetical protein